MRIKKILLACALLASASGCATSSGGKKVDQAALADFKTGVTTVSDVTQRLGVPTGMTTMSDGGKVLSYYSSNTSVNGATFIPIVGAFAGGAKSTASMTTFVFDKDGLLKSFSNTESKHDLNMGSSGQN